ncbi:anaerobic ribonucleoside-triphosphate reductase activating protein [bacterium]|nr:anaerobic ribonucleoside-triphosphate reductase activating protein [bacterium]MBU1994055.1 anaerobic ribonucleoside-triphosphate reductase activating protein [bacterium]
MNINSDYSSQNIKVIYDLTKFTHLDYAGHLACIVWFTGCNMRCDFCYNKEIVFSKNGSYSYEDILSFLKTRVNLLDGVVLSGGEASSHDLVEFCTQIKKLGFLIKLDTNGTNYPSIKELLELKLLDFVALDYKAPKDKFTAITHSNKYGEFSNTLDLLLKSEIDYEVRTTLHNDLLSENDINSILSDLQQRGYDKKYYLQKFLDTGTNIGNISAPSKSFDESKLLKEIQVVFR